MSGGSEGGPDPAVDLAAAARAVRERLELHRLAGWHVPIKRLAAGGRRLAGGAGTGEPHSKRPPEPAAPATEEKAETAAAARQEISALRAEREAKLAPIREEALACTRCALCHTRTQAVFGVGDPAARILFVGEAPGFDEDRQGEPFVGRAGQLLNDIIKAMGLRRSEVYIANVIKCRPPQNRVPNPAEVGSCLGYLESQIEIIQPDVIIALGAVAAKALLGTTESMGRIRSRFHDRRGIPVMPTYHPAYLLRNPAEKRKVWEDVQLVMARLGLQQG